MKNNTENGIEYEVYGTNDCFTFPNQNKCATESKRKIKNRFESEINEIKKIYYSKWGQKIYSGRGYTAKATLKHYKSLKNSEE